jgi:hypothetical protein
MERALHDLTSAFVSGGDRVDIAATRDLAGTWAIDPEQFERLAPWRTRGDAHEGNAAVGALIRAARPIRRQFSASYDLHIAFRWGPHMARIVRAGQQWINPAGEALAAEQIDDYDAVLLEAPNNIGLAPLGTRTVLLPPPLLPLSDTSDRPPNLPEEFVLTVFNAYSPAKGAADLRTLLDVSPMPVVWCTSSGTLRVEMPADLDGHPRLTVVREPSRAQLRYLYEHAYAYVSLSVTEGFGWAIADGLRYSPRVVARRVGVLSFDEALEPGVTLLDDTLGVAGLDWDVLDGALAPAGGRNLDWLSADAFRARVAAQMNH